MQETNYWCGPAVGEMILRYLGLNKENNNSNVLLNQNNLTIRMTTNASTWTNPIGFTSAINSWIGNRLNGRLYSNISLWQIANVYNDNLPERYRIFFNIIRHSLSNNMPVAIANYGRDLNPQASTNGLQRHFLLFTGYSGGNEYNPQNVTYHYIDPGDGNYYSVSANSFFGRGNLDTMGAWIIANTDQNFLEQNHLRDEHFEAMEIENNIDPTVWEENKDIITVIKILEENEKNPNNENLKAGDTYIATKNRVYFMTNDIIIGKFLIDSIKDITFSIVGKNDKGETYDLTLDLNDWSPKKITRGHNELK